MDKDKNGSTKPHGEPKHRWRSSKLCRVAPESCNRTETQTVFAYLAVARDDSFSPDPKQFEPKYGYLTVSGPAPINVSLPAEPLRRLEG